MANNKQEAKQMLGLPTKEQVMLSPQNTDKIPAQIHAPDGTPSAPAALTEGEFVFSNPAIIALGQGDHEKGIQILTELHDKLQAMGEQMMQQQQGQPPAQGLAAVPQ